MVEVAACPGALVFAQEEVAVEARSLGLASAQLARGTDQAACLLV